MVQAGALEDVQHIVHIELGQPVRQHCAGQVGMAVMVKIFAGQHLVDVGIATRAEQVMQAAAVLVGSVTGQTVIGDGYHWPQNGRFDHNRSWVLTCAPCNCRVRAATGARAGRWRSRH